VAVARVKPRSRRLALVFSVVWGSIALDRFYLGYTGLGTVKLLTLGGCGIWWLLDIVRLLINSLKDADGNALVW
jgi:TM2 domain-containing membrane protein YozV